MPRARRLASTVVVAALAATGLAACNRAPNVAVYFGDKKAVTETEVQRIWDDSSAKLVADAEGKKVMPVDRQTIVNIEVAVGALRALSQKKGFSPAQVPAADIAQQLTMEPSAPLVTLAAEYQGLRTAALQSAQPANATEADLRDIYSRFKTAGTEGSYEQFTATITDDVRQQIGPPLGLRNDLKAESADLHIKVNPRYQAPTLPLLTTTSGNSGSLTLIDVVLGSGTPSAPVIDLKS